MAELKLALVPFTVPNYVSLKMPPRPKQDGVQPLPSFALSEIDAGVLSDLCDEFRVEVFRKAGKPDPHA